MANTSSVERLKRNSIILVIILIAAIYSFNAWTNLQYANYLEQRNEDLFAYNHYISSIEDVLLSEGFSEDGISTLNFYATSTLEKMIVEDNALSELVLKADLLRLKRDNLRSDAQALEMHTELESYIVKYQGVYAQISLVSSFRACVADIDLQGVSSTVASASINACLANFNTESIDQEYLVSFAGKLRSYWELTSELYRRDGTTEDVNNLSKQVKSAQSELDQSQARWEANRETVLNINEVEGILATQ